MLVTMHYGANESIWEGKDLYLKIIKTTKEKGKWPPSATWIYVQVHQRTASLVLKLTNRTVLDFQKRTLVWGSFVTVKPNITSKFMFI